MQENVLNQQSEVNESKSKLNNYYQKWQQNDSMNSGLFNKYEKIKSENQFKVPKPILNKYIEINDDDNHIGKGNGRKKVKKNDDDFPSLSEQLNKNTKLIFDQMEIISQTNAPSTQGSKSSTRKRAVALEYNYENVKLLQQQNEEKKSHSVLPEPIVKNGFSSNSHVSGMENVMMKKMQNKLDEYKAQSQGPPKRRPGRPRLYADPDDAFSTTTPNTSTAHSHEMQWRQKGAKRGRPPNVDLANRVNYLSEVNSTNASQSQQRRPTLNALQFNTLISDEEGQEGNIKDPDAQLSSDFSDSSECLSSTSNMQDQLQNELINRKDIFKNCYTTDDNNKLKFKNYSQSNDDFDNASTMAGGSMACAEDVGGYIVDSKKTYGLNEKQVAKKNKNKTLIRADGTVLENIDVECTFEKVVEGGKILREFEPLNLVPFNADSVQPGFIIKEAELISDPEYFYNLMLPDEFFQQVVIWTNKKGKKQMQSHPCSKVVWSETNLAELKGFFGLSYIFGMVRKGCISEHWTTDEMTETPFTSSMLTLNRYMQIRKFLCFYDVDEPYSLKKNCTFKIRFFPDSLIRNVAKVYIPNRNLALDESMIKFTGRHHLKQLMPRKPIRQGFKAYVLCECKSGLALDWFLDPVEAKTEEGRFYEKVVYKLTRKYQNKGYRIYMDRFYSSVRLFSKLSQMGLGACGAIQQGRVQGMMSPEDFLNISHFKINTTIFFLGNVKGTKDNCNVLLVAWTPTYNRCGLIMSNFHSFNTIDKDIWSRIKNDDKLSKKRFKFAQITEDQPQIITDYNSYMGGVDHFDMLMSKFLTNHSFVRKWYGRIIYYMSEFAMVNSFILFRKVQKKQGTKELTNHQYRTIVLEGLISSFRKTKDQSQFKNKHVEQAQELLAVLSKVCHLQALTRQQNTLYKCSVCSSSSKALAVCKTHNNQIICGSCQSVHQLIQGQTQK